jgi:hypothetical protein
MNPKAVELQARTQRFATAVIKFCEALPKNPAAQQIAQQLVASRKTAQRRKGREGKATEATQGSDS